MANKSILVGNIRLQEIIDEVSAINNNGNQAISMEAFNKVRNRLILAVDGLKTGQIAVVNQRLLEALDTLEIIIGNNDVKLAELVSYDFNGLRVVKTKGDDMLALIATLRAQYDTTQTEIATVDEDILEIEEAIQYIQETVGYASTITLTGSSDKFYPIWWDFPSDTIGYVTIERDNTLTTSYEDTDMSLYLKCRGIGGKTKRVTPKDLRIVDFTERNGISARLVSQDIYEFPSGGDPVTEGSFTAPLGNSVFLRGDTQYTVTCSSPEILTMIESSVTQVGDDYTIISEGVTYHLGAITETQILNIISDTRLKWLFRDQTRIKFISVAEPTSITIPALSATGDYTVSWTTDSGVDVSYILEESEDINFDNTTVIYSGSNLSYDFTDHNSSIFYYRVKAISPTLADSAWVEGAAACVVDRPIEPPTALTNDNFSIGDIINYSFTPSVTTDVSYILEESFNDVSFSNSVEVYSGENTSGTLTDKADGIYYYRVKAVKDKYTDSTWNVSDTYCTVEVRCIPPASLTNPVGVQNVDNYTVSWEASGTPDVIYELQEATDVSFTANLNTVLDELGTLSTSINGKIDGDYYYRVRAHKTGMPASVWVLCDPIQIRRVADSITSLQTSLITDGSGMINVSWNASATVGAVYEIRISTDAGFGTYTVAAYDSSLTDTNIMGTTPGTNTYVAVYAYIRNCDHGTPVIASSPVLIPNRVAPVSNPVFTSGLITSFPTTLSWVASSDAPVTYHISEVSGTPGGTDYGEIATSSVPYCDIPAPSETGSIYKIYCAKADYTNSVEVSSISVEEHNNNQ